MFVHDAQLSLGAKKIFEVNFRIFEVKYITTYAKYRKLYFLERFKYYISFWLRQRLMKIQDGCHSNMSSGPRFFPPKMTPMLSLPRNVSLLTELINILLEVRDSA